MDCLPWHARLDVFPEFAPPQVQIQTEAPGLAAEQVEALVTQPLESALNGMIGLATLRSRSMQGLSTIVLTFRDNTDIHRDRQAVAERLAAIGGTLPQGVKAPTVLPLASSTSDIMNVGLFRHRSPMGAHLVRLDDPAAADECARSGGCAQCSVAS
jgi:Cu/Ag efflux pump CusA